ncbi:hypothetical protein HC024_11025 [Methylococcaceae bacterium WWC4]|nr:hypothetical protein [Methylococcaceae bacterium WWC4]
MYKPIFCISRDIGQTAKIVNNLKVAGFSNNDISLLSPECCYQQSVGNTSATADEHRLDLQWINGIENLEIPGVGRCITAGPIRIELSRSLENDGVEDINAALIGAGIPAHHAEHYREKIIDGLTLIAVNTASSESRDTANTIFQQAEALYISSSEEVSVNN